MRHSRLKNLRTDTGAKFIVFMVPGAGLEPAQTFRSEGF